MPSALPKPPGMKLPSNPLDALRDVIREGRDTIEKASNDIRSLADELHSGVISRTPPTIQSSGNTPRIEPQSPTLSSKVTTEETIAYQKRELGKELLLLEKHLEQGCRIPPIVGEPCDCCSPKHTITIEALALETYGLTGDIFYQEIAKWAKEVEGKTTVSEINSGQHNYGIDAVQSRNYRKKLLGSESLGALLSPKERTTEGISS